jgi:hypothetical protein
MYYRMKCEVAKIDNDGRRALIRKRCGVDTQVGAPLSLSLAQLPEARAMKDLGGSSAVFLAVKSQLRWRQHGSEAHLAA